MGQAAYGVATRSFCGAISPLGTAILLGATWVVGMILLADQVVAVFFGAIGFLIRKTLGFAAPKWLTGRITSRLAKYGVWREAEDRNRKQKQYCGHHIGISR
jgi:hypothetical protein